MNFVEFTNKLVTLRMGVFSLDSAQRILGTSRAYTSLFISRNVAKGSLVLVKKGTYALPGSTYAEIASNVYTPSYMTMAAALYYSSAIDQFPNVIVAFSTLASRGMQFKNAYGNYSLRIVKVRSDVMFGFKRVKEASGFAYVAEPEKAIVDALYMPRYCPTSYVTSAINSKSIKMEKVLLYAKRINSKALLKRLHAITLSARDEDAVQV